jgi:YggT family protein
MSLLYAFISVYEVIVFVAILSSWIPSDNLIFQFVRELTEPVLNPIRKILPAVAGFDFSPMILLLALHALKRVLAAH